jgi:Anti-sigma-K factor rskA, C-terminal
MRAPDFNELVGADLEDDERERLRRVHALLVEAGPPPELSPHLEAGPTLAMTIGGRRRSTARGRVMLLAAAIAALLLAFLGGYVLGNGGGGTSATGIRVLKLAGTRAAPHALASLEIQPVDAAGNWPMKLSVTGLPKLPARSYYEVYLIRNGKPWGSCGTFVVSGASRATSVSLNAPYRLKRGDSWVVTREPAGASAPGTVVLQPTV